MEHHPKSVFIILSLLLLTTIQSKLLDILEPIPLVHIEAPSKKRIDIPFELSSINQLIVNLCIGTPPQCFPFKISTTQVETFIVSKRINQDGYEPNDSSTFRETEDKYEVSNKNTNLIATIVSDKLTIPSISFTLETFSFGLVDEGSLDAVNYVGVLGLGKRFEENEFSFISNLFMLDQIDHVVFSLNYERTGKGGYLSIGYHEDIENDKIYKSCTLVEEDEREPSFDVYIDSIIYSFPNDEGNARSFKRQQPAFFSPGANRIFCPGNFFRFLRRRIFRRELGDGGICNVGEENEFMFIECTEEIFNRKIGELKFVFGKWSVDIQLSKLFVGYGDKYTLDIYKLPDHFESKWILGYPFLRMFPVVFDMDGFSIKIKK
jgi:hypothetical protein